VLKSLKAHEQTRDIPVICVSISDDLVPQALELGAVQYIRKPVDPGALLEGVKAAVLAQRQAATEIPTGGR
jgi:CheY-like chemotaxis protein